MFFKKQNLSLKTLFREIDETPVAYLSHRPTIGLSANRTAKGSCVAEAYSQALVKAGADPILVPITTDPLALASIVEKLDGLVMTGGGDFNPLLVEEEPIRELGEVDTYRDVYDLALLRMARRYQLPIFGICRGVQLLNIAFGGTVYQDQYVQCSASLGQHVQLSVKDEPCHSVRLTDGPSRLREVFPGKDQLLVNSFHHQVIKEVAPDFKVTANALDGLIEAIEHVELPFWGVQWHPEAMAAHKKSLMLALFERQVKEARLYHQAKVFHQHYVTFDSHTDTPMFFPHQMDFGIKAGNKVNLPFMEEGRIDAVAMVAYIPQGDRTDKGLAKATAYAFDRLKEARRQAIVYPKRMEIALIPEDVQRLKLLHKKAIFLGVENGYAIGKALDTIDQFKDLGVSYITLCHNGNNDLCDSASDKAEWNGLSPFGCKVIHRMNDLGIMVDLSHAAESSFYQALEESRVPIVASHSSARALCDHPRNLTDDQLRALAQKGGVAQVCLFYRFINEEANKASLSDAIRHLLHMIDVAGIDHVGVGSDFDGGGGLIGCRQTNELIHITTRLMAEGLSEQDIAKVWGGNFLRVMSEVQDAAGKTKRLD